VSGSERKLGTNGGNIKEVTEEASLPFLTDLPINTEGEDPILAFLRDSSKQYCETRREP
jgi:hypothetical protein